MLETGLNHLKPVLVLSSLLLAGQTLLSLNFKMTAALHIVLKRKGAIDIARKPLVPQVPV